MNESVFVDRKIRWTHSFCFWFRRRLENWQNWVDDVDERSVDEELVSPELEAETFFRADTERQKSLAKTFESDVAIEPRPPRRRLRRRPRLWTSSLGTLNQTLAWLSDQPKGRKVTQVKVSGLELKRLSSEKVLWQLFVPEITKLFVRSSAAAILLLFLTALFTIVAAAALSCIERHDFGNFWRFAGN